MSRALRLVTLASTVMLGALCASLFMAIRQRPHPTLRQLRSVGMDNWGVHSLFQLELGLLLAAVWILCVHRRKWVALLWVAGIVVTGHIATLIYIIHRSMSARTVAEAFLPQVSPAERGGAAPEIHACDAAFNVELPDPADSDVEADDATPVEDRV